MPARSPGKKAIQTQQTIEADEWNLVGFFVSLPTTQAPPSIRCQFQRLDNGVPLKGAIEFAEAELIGTVAEAFLTENSALLQQIEIACVNIGKQVGEIPNNATV